MKGRSHDAQYRPSIGLMLINRQGLVFVAKRINTAGDAWQMPQGGINRGEDPRDAALRELLEETGTDNAEIIAETPSWLYYDLPGDLAGRMWRGRYRGQRQKWYALHFLGSDDDFDLAGEHPEFSEWRWAPIDELVDLIVPFKRDVYRKVVDAFRPHAKPWG